MFPSEMVILMAIASPGDSGKKLLNRPTDVISEYLGYLYDSLVSRGYLKRSGSRGYELTSRGRETLIEFLSENRTKTEDIIEMLQRLGIESSLKIDELVKGAVEVR